MFMCYNNQDSIVPQLPRPIDGKCGFWCVPKLLAPPQAQ
jgi:hypothetical protein